ncbi:hypothetical protein EMIT0P171_90067 [Pseudomonas sp. IT-P171]
MQRVRLRRTALRATPRMNTSTQPPEGAGGSRSRAAGELTLGLMSGEKQKLPRVPCGSWLAGEGGPDTTFIQTARVIVNDHRWQASSHREMRTLQMTGRPVGRLAVLWRRSPPR